ncbi:MAG: hypothetical protein GY842_18835, partial [bacterium]|nr:hypothetical protein [bacterium]
MATKIGKLRIPHKGDVQVVEPQNKTELIRLRTELELLRLCGSGVASDFANAIESKTRQYADLCELNTILRDARHPAVLAAIAQIDEHAPEVKDAIEHDVVQAEAAKMRQDLATHVRTSPAENAAELADHFESATPDDSAPDTGDSTMSDSSIEDVLHNVELNVEALQELVEQSETAPTQPPADPAGAADNPVADEPTVEVASVVAEDHAEAAGGTTAVSTEAAAEETPSGELPEEDISEILAEAPPDTDTVAEQTEPATDEVAVDDATPTAPSDAITAEQTDAASPEPSLKPEAVETTPAQEMASEPDAMESSPDSSTDPVTAEDPVDLVAQEAPQVHPDPDPVPGDESPEEATMETVEIGEACSYVPDQHSADSSAAESEPVAVSDSVDRIQQGLRQVAHFLVTELDQMLNQAAAARAETLQHRAEAASAQQEVIRLRDRVSEMQAEVAKAADSAQQARDEAQAYRDEAQRARARA